VGEQVSPGDVADRVDALDGRPTARVDLDPARTGVDSDDLEAEPVDVRAPADRHHDLVRGDHGRRDGRRGRSSARDLRGDDLVPGGDSHRCRVRAEPEVDALRT
jgi:hypothetical protein